MGGPQVEVGRHISDTSNSVLACTVSHIGNRTATGKRNAQRTPSESPAHRTGYIDNIIIINIATCVLDRTSVHRVRRHSCRSGDVRYGVGSVQSYSICEPRAGALRTASTEHGAHKLICRTPVHAVHESKPADEAGTVR